MDNFWFWAGLTWNVMCAWVASLPAWVQVIAAFVVLYAAFCLLVAIVTTTARVVRWARGMRRPRLTLVQVEQPDEEAEETQETPAVVEQEEEKPSSATIISIEVWLRKQREAREVPEEGA